MVNSGKAWYSELNRYHWFVLIICTLAWSFDCLDQQLFALARAPAVAELLNVSEAHELVPKYTGYATSWLLIGWATGGIFFGIMGDKYGRARTMVWTILTYSVFTGLCGVAQSVEMFILFRFLTGLGVGGQFAVGVALVAEVMPDRARPRALGMLQAMATIGNISAGLIGIGFVRLEAANVLPYSAWRWMFFVGVLPALLAILVIRHLKEPERWTKAVAEGRTGGHGAGSLAELFGVAKWRRRVIVGMLLALVGVIGLWGIGFFTIDLNRSVFRKIAEQRARDEGLAKLDRQFVQTVIRSPSLLDKEESEANSAVLPQDLLSLNASNNDPRLLYSAALWLHEKGKPVSTDSVLQALDHPQPKATWSAQSAKERQRRASYLEGKNNSKKSFADLTEEISDRKKKIDGEVGWWGSITSMLFNIGAFFGIYSFSVVTDRLGRRLTFVIFFLAAMVSTAIAFAFMDSQTELLWMVPLMGFFQLALFGGYAIYLPELFPTRLRSTAVSFCYNIGRYVAALGPAMFGWLSSEVFKDYAEPTRYAGLTMCSIFLLGVVVIMFAPETKGQPLPD